MKKFFSNPKKIIRNIICVIIIILIANYFLPPFFIVHSDSDTECYQSGKGLMSFCDGKLIVDPHDNNYAINGSNAYSFLESANVFEYYDVYSGIFKNQVFTPANAYIAKDNRVFIYQDELYYTTINTAVKIFISANCKKHYYDGENIVFVSGTDLYLSEIIDNKRALKEKLYTFGENEVVDFIQIFNDKLYVTTVIGRSTDTIIQYNFYVFDINSMSLVDSCSCDIPCSPSYICICNGKFVYNHKDSSTVFTVDFEKKQQEILFEHDNIVSLASNGEKVYLVSEKLKIEKLVIDTAETDSNGVWEVDITTGKERKISDACVIEDILATDNYVYCYAIDYKVPRGISSMIPGSKSGYKILQYKIN